MSLGLWVLLKEEEGDAWLGRHPPLPPSLLGGNEQWWGSGRRVGGVLLRSGLDPALERTIKEKHVCNPWCGEEQAKYSSSAFKALSLSHAPARQRCAQSLLRPPRQ